jgi:hypothetical protein
MRRIGNGSDHRWHEARTLYVRWYKRRSSWECLANGCVFIDLLVFVCDNFHSIRSAPKTGPPTDVGDARWFRAERLDVAESSAN